MLQSINPFNSHDCPTKESTYINPNLYMGKAGSREAKVYENLKQGADNSARACGTSMGKVSELMWQWAWVKGSVEVSQGAKGNDGKMDSKGSKLGALCVYRVAGGLEWGRPLVLAKGPKRHKSKFRWARAMSKAKEYYVLCTVQEGLTRSDWA